MHIAVSIEAIDTDTARGIELAARADFEYVALTWRDVHRQLMDRGGGVGTLKGLVGEFGVQVAAVYAGSASAEREDQIASQTAHFRTIMTRARQIACPLMIITAGARTLENFNAIRRSLVALADAGEELGVTVALANRCKSRVEDRRDLLALFLSEELSRVRLCLDTFEFQQACVNCSDLIIEHGGRIGAVHLGDSMGSTPVPLGKGEVNFTGLFARLKEADYDGPLIVGHLPRLGSASVLGELRSVRNQVEELAGV